MVKAQHSGFSLVEVIVALTLLAVGVLSIAGTALLASRFNRDSELNEEVANRAVSLLDSLTAAADSGNGVVASDRYDLEWRAGGNTVEVTAKVQDSVVFVLRAFR